MSVGCVACCIACFCKCQSHFRLSLILFCLLPLVSSDCENKSAEERAKLVYLRSRSHLKVKQQFFNAIYQKVADQVRKQAILTQSSSVFYFRQTYTTPRQCAPDGTGQECLFPATKEISCGMHDNSIQEANGMVMFY